MRALLVLLALSLAGPAAAADAPKKQKVAMLAVRAAPGVAQQTADLLGEVIATDAGRSPKHQLISAVDVATALSVERQKQLLGCSDDSGCIAEIANALGADFLLDVSVGTIGNLRVLTMRLIEAGTGKAALRESETVGTEADLVDAAHRLTARLFDLPLSRGRTVPGIVVMSGAGALAIGGVVMGVMANNSYQSFKADPFNDPLGDRAKTQAYAADGLYAGALVAAGVATWLLLTDKIAQGGGGGE